MTQTRIFELIRALLVCHAVYELTITDYLAEDIVQYPWSLSISGQINGLIVLCAQASCPVSCHRNYSNIIRRIDLLHHSCLQIHRETIHPVDLLDAVVSPFCWSNSIDCVLDEITAFPSASSYLQLACNNNFGPRRGC